MFDSFKPFQVLQKQDFSFHALRFELWATGKMISNGKTNAKIVATVVRIDGTTKVKVTFSDTTLNHELAAENLFDEFVTGGDRLQLVIIPEQTNSQNMGISMFKSTFGATRHIKNFNKNEPYCCNLFLQSGKIVKITFSYSNPEKLLEFYSSDDIDYTPNENPHLEAMKKAAAYIESIQNKNKS